MTDIMLSCFGQQAGRASKGRLRYVEFDAHRRLWGVGVETPDRMVEHWGPTLESALESAITDMRRTAP